MANYTVLLKTVCESLNGLSEPVDYPQIAQLIEDSRAKIFDFDYPIFDEAYRKVLETKIIKHFLMREINEYTYGMWKLRLDTKMNELMPYYNQLYKSETLIVNPLYTMNYTRTRKDSGGDLRTISENGEDERNSNKNRENSGTSSTDNTLSGSGNSQTDTSRGETLQTNDVQSSTTKDNNTRTIEGSDNRKQMYSDTPQGALTNVENGTYLTNATVNKDTNNSTTTEELNGENKISSANKHLTTGQDLSKVNNVYNEQNNNENEYSNTDNETSESSGNYTKNVTDNITTTREYVEMLQGGNGQSESELLIQYRNTFLNIDMQLLEELDVLFMGLW